MIFCQLHKVLGLEMHHLGVEVDGWRVVVHRRLRAVGSGHGRLSSADVSESRWKQHPRGFLEAAETSPACHFSRRITGTNTPSEGPAQMSCRLDPLLLPRLHVKAQRDRVPDATDVTEGGLPVAELASAGLAHQAPSRESGTTPTPSGLR